MEPLDLPRSSPATYRHHSPGDGTPTPTATPNSSFKRPSGIPPAHPHYSQIPPPSPISSQQTPTHSRSLSQPTFFSLDSLPPLNPTSISPNPSPRPSSSSLPPRKAHRRSHSDVPLGFTAPPPVKQESQQEVISTDDLVSAYMNLENLEMLNSSEASGTKDSSENEAESSSLNETGASSGMNEQKKREGCGNKRGATGELVLPGNPRHCRSLSMDSFMGRLNFGEESPKFGPVSPGNPSLGNQSSGGLSRSGSLDGSFNPFGVELGAGEFSEAEIKKIKANDKLSEMAMTDPKRVRRILANRLSAARSKERKMRYMSELEHKVQTLQTEATTLSAQLTLLQRDSSGLLSQNNELKIRLQAMEQQAQLRDALNEALTAEVKRLKLATGEISESHHSKANGGMNNHHQYSLSSQMLQQMQHMQLQQRQQQQGSLQLQQNQRKPQGSQQQQEV